MKEKSLRLWAIALIIVFSVTNSICLVQYYL